ncbi:hypothetical protein [Croceivirga radicis]|uniref:hypothetical protein n=1 Tax=Croceivirga radicis TaxID=1929488 RepID=UPI0002EB7984|nr:hypothetical protein [Croceivirga radicis]
MKQKLLTAIHNKQLLQHVQHSVSGITFKPVDLALYLHRDFWALPMLFNSK